MFDLLLGATVNKVAMVTAAEEAKTYHVITLLCNKIHWQAHVLAKETL